MVTKGLDGLGRSDGTRKDDTGNLFVYKGRGMTSGEKGFSEVSSVGVDVIQVAADLPPPNGQREGDGTFSGWRLVGLIWREVWR